jgi:hypothetical protein
MSLVKVRLRQQSDGVAVPFTEWPLDDLESVLSVLRYWGGVYVTGGRLDGTIDALSGQIVLQDGKAYFEVIVCDDDDD